MQVGYLNDIQKKIVKNKGGFLRLRSNDDYVRYSNNLSTSSLQIRVVHSVGTDLHFHTYLGLCSSHLLQSFLQRFYNLVYIPPLRVNSGDTHMPNSEILI